MGKTVSDSPEFRSQMLPHGETVGRMTDRLIMMGKINEFLEVERRINRSKGGAWGDRDLDGIRVEALTKFAALEAAGGKLVVRAGAEDHVKDLAEQVVAESKGVGVDVDDPFGEEKLSAGEAKRLLDKADKEGLTAGDDALWVFHSLAVEGVRREKAPSPGAWGWLCFLKSDPKALADFYRTVVPKMLPSSLAKEREREEEDDGWPVMSLIDRMVEGNGRDG